MYLVLNIGCLECGTWSYVYGVYATIEEGYKGLLELTNKNILKQYEIRLAYTGLEFKPREAKDLIDMKEPLPYTCISYYRGTDWIAELHEFQEQRL